jgi:hypothetical protein
LRRRRSVSATAGRGAGLLAAACLAAACGSPGTKPIRPEYDLHDPSGTKRAQAIATVSRTRDTSQVPALILLLDDEDPAVRMSAGATLKDLTGHDTGYRPYADAEERHAHQDLWRQWWAGRGAPAPAPAPTPAGGPGAGAR